MNVRKQFRAPTLLLLLDETLVPTEQETGWTLEVLGTLY